jgi:CHAT domain-containing protein/cytochrome c-type biogenesis protein CcmH/NrfG
LEDHPHIAECSACREQFEELVQFDRQIKIAQMENDKPIRTAQAGCPDQAIWREIAAGLTAYAQTLSCVEHASGCSHCGPLLHTAVADLGALGQTLSDAERKYIATLQSANPDWQRQLTSRIAGVPLSGSSQQSKTTWSGMTWLRPSAASFGVAGASLLAIIALASWGIVHRSQSPAAERLLARAYTEQRTLELRITGAEYAPLRISRGAQTSFNNRSEALLKAEALISTGLQSHPSDATWLQAEAQADLLEGKYDAAVESLRRALQLSPHSPAILTDLGTAYFQRAQQEDKQDDLGTAYEYLSRALQFRPDDPVALFNRAIVSEHQFLYHQAIEDWEHYLRVEPASQWAEEARNHANNVREILKRHGNMAPLLSPAGVVAAAAATSGGSDIDPRIEEYLQEAVRSWLPQAFPETRPSANADASRALFFLAQLARQQHGDTWLADLLQGSSAPRFPKALASLARSVTANEAGDYDVSRQQAKLAEKSFRVSGNMAGVLRAQFEQTYAAQINRNSEECRRKATAGLAKAESYSYPWLQIELGLEEGVCSALMEDLGTYGKMAQRAMDRAQNHGYGGLYLRSLLFLADQRIATGDRPGAWKLSFTGLQSCWSGLCSPARAYNIYGGLAYDTGSHDQFHLQVAFWQEAIAVFGPDKHLLYRATAHELLARAASAAHQPRLASEQHSEAARLYALSPRTEASRTDAIENQVRNAQLELDQGQTESALTQLISVQDQIRSLSNDYVIQMFYSVLGELQLRRHREVEAEQALKPALALAEQSLASLRSEEERIAWKNNAAPVYLALTEAKLLQGHQQESLEVYERYLGASQGVAKREPPDRQQPMEQPLRLPLLLPLLSHETVLAFAALPDGLAIWVCDDRGVHAEWVAKPTDDLQELSNLFYDMASDPKSDISTLRRDGRSLYNALILPVEPRLAPGRTLVIEADGWLARVPFEALVDAGNHYLIERWPVVHSLGQDSEARLRTDNSVNGSDSNQAAPISARMPALVVASDASSQKEGLPPLVGISAEADAVASGFRSARVLKGSEATLRGVQQNLPSAEVFHFAGHSLDTPDRSGLMLKDAGPPTGIPSLLDAAAVRKLNASSLRLAVLSACSTGSGAGGPGGFHSITEALLRAGVPHVVASRWEAVETRGFMNDFYRSALSGQSVSEAVRQASRNMLADSRTAHPYYWSAFAAYGRP